MNESEINRLTDDTLNSINDLKRTSPDDRIFQKIVNGINKNEISYLKERGAGKYLIAFVILIIINIFSIYGYNGREENRSEGDPHLMTSELNDFAREFLSEPDEYNYNK